jgi:hypothetical protein
MSAMLAFIMPRFVLLEHTGHPDDPAGLHYDLLLEDGAACRTWRLTDIPTVGGSPVATVELPPHRLEWLDRLQGEVSGGRGFACRIDAGSYEHAAPVGNGHPPGSHCVVDLQGVTLAGRLKLEPGPGGRTTLTTPEPAAPTGHRHDV